MRLHEERSYTATVNDTLNPNSYSAIAVFGLISLATEVLHENDQELKRSMVMGLAQTFSALVLEEQQQWTGSTSFQDGMNTRVRGLLRTVLATLPVPFGAEREVWDEWYRKVGVRLHAMTEMALDLWSTGLVTDPYEELVELSKPKVSSDPDDESTDKTED